MVIEIKTDKPYEVIVEDGVLDRAGEKIAPLVRPGSRAMIVSETNVFPIYGERLKASLEKAGIHTAEFVFEAGEPQKQLSTVMKIYEALAENDFTRSDIIVTLGGGVVLFYHAVHFSFFYLSQLAGGNPACGYGICLLYAD